VQVIEKMLGMELMELEVQVAQSVKIRFFSQAYGSWIHFCRFRDKYE
jgi:hypothetical protein